MLSGRSASSSSRGCKGTCPSRSMHNDTKVYVTALIIALDQALVSRKLPGPRVRPSWIMDKHMPTCAFRSPDKVIVNLLRASTQTTSQVKSCVLDAMASCGVYRDYAVRKKKFDTAVDVRDAPRPQLPGYGSMKWGLIRNWLANY